MMVSIEIELERSGKVVKAESLYDQLCIEDQIIVLSNVIQQCVYAIIFINSEYGFV